MEPGAKQFVQELLVQEAQAPLTDRRLKAVGAVVLFLELGELVDQEQQTELPALRIQGRAVEVVATMVEQAGPEAAV